MSLERSPVDDALGHFDIGRVIRVWPAAHGIENTNYFVATSSGDYVLTLLARRPFSGEGYFRILEALHDAGLPVAPPLPDVTGELSPLVQGRAVMLQPRLPGAHVGLPTEIQLQALGRLIARLHIESAHLSRQIHAHPRDTEWMRGISTLVAAKMRFSSSSLLLETIDTVSHLLSRNDVASLPSGVIHGDIFRDNVLFDGDALCGILDFHQAARGQWLFDLAVVANDWCCDVTGQLNQNKALALLKGYHSQRPLSRQELWFFSPFRVYAALTFWLARLEVQHHHQHVRPVRSKNPRDMETIVAVLRRGFHYFDERLFE